MWNFFQNRRNFCFLSSWSHSAIYDYSQRIPYPIECQEWVVLYGHVRTSSTDLQCYPLCFTTSDATWDPSVVNKEFLPRDDVNTLLDHICEQWDECVDAFGDCNIQQLTLTPQHLQHQLAGIDSLHPHFGWLEKECIHNTLNKTSQYY